jgi:nitroreductase
MHMNVMDQSFEASAGVPADGHRDARMRALELLLDRQSVGVLQEPAPEGAELDLILDAGLRAPDHGKLRPWRFVLIRGEQRKAWADRVAAAALARDPENGAAIGERYRAWVDRTPLIIALGVEVRAGHKIPEIEQLLSAGAAAMNMLNAIHLLGYGGMWVTGVNAYDPAVAAALGFEAPSRLAGFIAVGTPRTLPRADRPSRAEHTRDWTG